MVLLCAATVAACGGPSAFPDEQTKALACQAPLRLGKAAMPTAVRLAAARTFGFNDLVLSPPLQSDRPAVSAPRAWDTIRRDLPSAARYTFVLAEANSGEALGGPSPSPLLVWVARGNHVVVHVHGRSARPCVFESADVARRCHHRCGLRRVDVSAL